MDVIHDKDIMSQYFKGIKVLNNVFNWAFYNNLLLPLGEKMVK
jgi:hypothetical protein